MIFGIKAWGRSNVRYPNYTKYGAYMDDPKRCVL